MKGVTVAGCGPGSRDHMTLAVIRAVSEADLLVGPPRLLDLFPDISCEKLVLQGNYKEALDLIVVNGEERRVVVLVTGDPGVHSYARLILDRLGRSSCRVLPGVSSVQYAFSLLGMPWEDAVIFSCHGESLDGLESTVRDNPVVAVLTGGEDDPARIGRELAECTVGDRDIYLCENLSMEGERVARMTIDELKNAKSTPLNLVVIVEGDHT